MIDAWQRVALSLGGIDLVTVKAQIVVGSIETDVKTCADPRAALPMSRPAFGQQTDARDQDARGSEEANAMKEMQFMGRGRKPGPQAVLEPTPESTTALLRELVSILGST